MQTNTHKLFSLAAIVVASVLFGMVIAGALNITPSATADPQAQQPEMTAVTAMFPTGAPDFASLAEQVVPSVVSIYTKDVQEPDERRRRAPVDPFHFFFGPQEDDDGEPIVRESSGSGFFITATGEVLTNNHVVEDADELEIELDDGSRYEVEVVGRDPATDIAVVKVKDGDRRFPVLPMGDSAGVRVAEWVMAVGNPLQMDHTVTVGVVSAKGRVLGLSRDVSFENFIQTDAAINFGNSGGPLVNLRGEVIGINTAINARGQNLSFAVPINTAKRILPQLRESGKVVRGYLGIRVNNITQEMQEAFDLKDRDGAMVEEVMAGKAADKGGLRHGDVIIRIDDLAVDDTRALIDYISSLPPGRRVEVEALRDDDRETFSVMLEAREGGDDEAEEGDEADERSDTAERVGIEVVPLTDRVRQAYRVDETVDGLLIASVKAVSPAAEAGLRRGDVIVEANGEKLNEANQLLEEIRGVKKNGYLRLYVYRPQADQSFFAIVKLTD